MYISVVAIVAIRVLILVLFLSDNSYVKIMLVKCDMVMMGMIKMVCWFYENSAVLLKYIINSYYMEA